MRSGVGEVVILVKSGVMVGRVLVTLIVSIPSPNRSLSSSVSRYLSRLMGGAKPRAGVFITEAEKPYASDEQDCEVWMELS